MSVKDFIKNIKTDYKDMVVNRHLGVEFNDESEILAEFNIDENKLADLMDFNENTLLKGFKQITFMLEYSIETGDINAWYQVLCKDNNVLTYDYALTNEDQSYLEDMVSEYIKNEYGFDDIQTYGECFKKMSGYILIGDVDYSFSKYGSEEPNINFDIGFYDEFIHDFCDSFKEHDIYNNYREFYLSKNLDTGKLTLKEHLTNDDYEVDEWNDLTDKFSEDELKALWVCCRWDYEHSYNESFKDYEKAIREEYEDYMKDEVER